MSFLQPFLRADPPPFDRLELRLPEPDRGHTCTLSWCVAGGALVTTGQTLFRWEPDADPAASMETGSPFPARVEIHRPSGRFLRPGPIGRLHYGYALEAFFRRSWQELALALAAELGRRRQAAPLPEISPRTLMQLVLLEQTLRQKLQAAGLCPAPPPVPADLREDRALVALEELCHWKSTAVRTAAPPLPDSIGEQTLLLWEHLFANLAASLREEGLAPEDGLSADSA